MNTYEIYTLGSGHYLEMVFNAIRLVFESGYTNVLKAAVAGSLVVLAFRAGFTSNFKDMFKWLLSVVIVTSLFLTTKAKVVIIEQLPSSNGRLPAAYHIDNVPWGLAIIGSTTSIIGKTIMEKFDLSFSAASTNVGSGTYQKYGILFGSKIVEDASRTRINSPSLRNIMISFYKQCVIPDLKMGHNRTNGYTLDELAQTENIAGFLKAHAANARTIYIDTKVTKKIKRGGDKDNFLDFISGISTKSTNEKGYYSCNQAAHIIADMVEYEISSNLGSYSASFLGQFTSGKNNASQNQQQKNSFFEAMLKNNYSKFLSSSREAGTILMQNVMINSIRDSASSVADSYGQVTTEAMTKSSFYSVSQVFQKFIPIIRAVFECLFYGVSPIILILMLTPIGIDVLKNYAFSFIYLQMWPPMYAILYSITQSWSTASAVGLRHNMQFLPQIESINGDIAMVSGYMLAMIPVLSLFVTKGLVASIGNLTNSMLYIPQTAAVQSSEQSVHGNYSFGNTNIDTHSNNNLNANKHDDNYAWMSGMKSFSMPSGASMKLFADERVGLDASGAMSNLGGQVNIGWHQAIGNSFNESESNAQNEAERYSKDYIESASSGISKMLGYNTNYSKGSSAYQSINNSLSADQRKSFDYARSVTDRISKDANISTEDALRLSMGVRTGAGFAGISASLDASGYTSSQKREAWSKASSAMEDTRFSNSLSEIESFTKSDAVKTHDSQSQELLNSARSDFNQASSASSNHSIALDKLRSISTARSNYENQSSNYDKQFTNMFIEENAKKYGVEHLEQLVRSNPNNIDPLVEEFVRSKNLIHKFMPKGVNSYNQYNLTDADRKGIKRVVISNNNSINSNNSENANFDPEIIDEKISHAQNQHGKDFENLTDQVQVKEIELINQTQNRKTEVENELEHSALSKTINNITNKITGEKNDENDNKDGK